MDNLKRQMDEGAALQNRIPFAADVSALIRLRLAAVADELRVAAATAASEKEGLLRLANTFERHSKPGDLS